MDKLTRKELKTDRFQVEVQHSVDYVTQHRSQLIRWGGIAAAVLLIAVAIVVYMRHAKSVREEQLAAALKIQNASIGAASSEYMIAFPTAEERDKAATKAFTELATKDSGTDEGEMAEYYLAAMAADKGNLAEAERRFKQVSDSSTPYAALAKLALAQVYAGQGKQNEAQNLVKSLIDKPTVLVSKEQATIALAQLVAPNNPEEARKLLEPLRGSQRGAVSRAAITELSELPRK